MDHRWQVFKKSQIIEAFMDPKSWLIFLINFVLNVPNNGVLTFNSIIVSELGFSTKETMVSRMKIVFKSLLTEILACSLWQSPLVSSRGFHHSVSAVRGQCAHRLIYSHTICTV